MRKLLALILAAFSGTVKAEPAAKLGTEGDPIRQMLFASQGLKEQAKRIHSNGTPGALQSIVDAAKLVDEGKTQEAITLLKKSLDLPPKETRIQLWLWSALRELGQKPDPEFAYEVLGAIIEYPSGDGYDTLAAYVDGSARYLNYSGKAIFWDADDPTVKSLCQGLVDATIPISNRAKPRTSLSLPRGNGQVTLLTRSGPFVIVSPPNSVINPGAKLMIELMKRSKEKQSANDPGSSK